MSSFLNQALIGGGSMLVRCSAMVGMIIIALYSPPFMNINLTQFFIQVLGISLSMNGQSSLVY